MLFRIIIFFRKNMVRSNYKENEFKWLNQQEKLTIVRNLVQERKEKRKKPSVSDYKEKILNEVRNHIPNMVLQN